MSGTCCDVAVMLWKTDGIIRGGEQLVLPVVVVEEGSLDVFPRFKFLSYSFHYVFRIVSQGKVYVPGFDDGSHPDIGVC